jgi:GNAT superfamily N-acetyltransferase
MIRKAKIDDLKQLSELFDKYRVFYEKDSNVNAAEIFLHERIHNNESEIFVDETDEKILTGFVQLYPIFSSTRMKKLWLLNDLFVLPNYRGKGISLQLIDSAKKMASDTNAVGVILETAKSNSIGNSLYLKTGFSIDDEHNYYSWDV